VLSLDGRRDGERDEVAAWPVTLLKLQLSLASLLVELSLAIAVRVPRTRLSAFVLGLGFT
jgi:hypothetical protein